MSDYVRVITPFCAQLILKMGEMSSGGCSTENLKMDRLLS